MKEACRFIGSPRDLIEARIEIEGADKSHLLIETLDRIDEYAFDLEDDVENEELECGEVIPAAHYEDRVVVRILRRR